MLSTLIKATKNHLKMSFGSFVLLPNITGWFGAEGGKRDAKGALSIETYSSWSYGGYTAAGHKVTLNASRSSSIYGNSTTVQPNSLIFYYIIKY